MLVARAQLDFIRELIARFKREESVMRPVTDYQSQYIAIIALLRSVGHVFEKVDCDDVDRRRYCKERWSVWKQDPIFDDFIQPTRNSLLKEFKGGLKLQDAVFGPVVFVAEPSIPGGVSYVAAFDASRLRDSVNQPVLPKLEAAVDFWARCLEEAETAFGEASIST